MITKNKEPKPDMFLEAVQLFCITWYQICY
jgi:hypothetical protein